MKNNKFYLAVVALILVLTITIPSCRRVGLDFPWQGNHEPGIQVDKAMVLYWNEKAATVLGAPMRQPDRSRYYAIIEIAVHDALNNIKPRFERFVLNKPNKSASSSAAVASAAYWAIKGLNLQGAFPVDNWYDSSLALIPDGNAKEAGKLLGQSAAEAIVANRANDGFTNIIPASPNPPDGTAPGAYRHTNLLDMRFIPNWGTVVKPFVVKTNSQFRPAGPYAVTSAEYAKDYKEIKAKGGRDISTRTSGEELLARFWSENRPSIIWNELARKIMEGKKMDAWETARVFALINTAMADGLNTAMDSKYHFYSWRPETAIHEGANDGNPSTTPDPAWTPFLIEVNNPANPAGHFVSPPVPEYPSAYAMYGGATTAILQSIFRSDGISVELSSANLPGPTIHYTSLSKAARDNSLSKVYAGWYFRKGALDGEEMGREIANYLLKHSFRKL